MTTATWPKGDHADTVGEIGGFLNFYAQPFELYVDNRSEKTSGKGGNSMVHNITLPYVNSVSTETSTWETNNNNDYLNRTDSDTGFWDWLVDKGGDIYDWFDFWYSVQTVNMEVSNAGYKGPVLRQRHYSYTLLNRSGTEEEGKTIAEICRSFQASVYGRMGDGARIADNTMLPPPMWWISYLPNSTAGDSKDFDRYIKPTGSRIKTGIGISLIPFPTITLVPRISYTGESDTHPSITKAGHNAWRWNMDPFTSVLVNVSISPTSATDAIQVPTMSGWPLITTLKLSFLEVDQVLGNKNHDAIIPYSWAQDEDSKFFRGAGKDKKGNVGAASDP